MVEAATAVDLTPEKQFKMAQDIANMYVALLKADKILKATAGEGEQVGSGETPSATIFQLHG
jgi:hypothetical protein